MMDERGYGLGDERDEFNDETFGDDGDKYNWEDAQGQDFFADVNFPEDGKHELKQVELQHERDDYTQYTEDDDENWNLEESISRVVLEDNLDEEDIARERIVKQSIISLMPPQVINRTLDWLQDQDLASPLFTSSVWSMHPTDLLSTPKTSSEPKSLVKETPRSPIRKSPSGPPPGLTQQPSGFRTLEEVERGILNSLPHPRSISPCRNDEILGSWRNSEISSGYNAQIPGLHFPQNTMCTGFVRNGGHTGPGLLQNPCLPRHLEGAIQPRTNAGDALYERRSQGPILPCLRGFPYRPPRFPQIKMRPNFDFMRARGPGHFPGPFMPPPMSRFPPRMVSGFNEMNAPRYVYGAVMNDQDKQRLKNIQIIQLQNDHPYTTDYYYQITKFKQTLDCRHLTRLFPAAGDEHHRPPYEPAHFDNCLGKLQAVSALAPKRIIDTYIKISGTPLQDKFSRISTLLEIESVFQLYMVLKEQRYRLAVNTLQITEQEELQPYAAILKKLDRHSTSFQYWLRYRKGRDIFLKLIREFDLLERGQNACYMIFSNMIKHYTIANMKKLENEPKYLVEACSSLGQIISKANAVQIDLLLQGIQNKMWSTSFGCTIFLTIMQKASQCIIQGSGYVDWRDLDNYFQANADANPELNYRDTFTGFARLPSAIRSFLNSSEEYGAFLPCADYSSKPLLLIMEESECIDIRVEGLGRMQKILHALKHSSPPG